MFITTDTRLEDLTLVKYLKEIQSPFLPKIIEVYSEIKSLLNTRIPQIFPHYTLHDTGHSFRIIEYMSKLVKDYKELDQLEITLLIYSALLHDIGMAASEDDVSAIKIDSFSPCETKFSVMKKLMNNDDILTLQEYIRRIHASLSARHIREKLKDKFIISNNSLLTFTNELALICESHTEDYDWIKRNLSRHEIRGSFHFNPQYIAVILRLADILDIDSNRTPYKLYEQIAPKGESNNEWKQHFIITNDQKIITDEHTQQKKIVLHGKVKDPNTHRKLLGYISWIGDELAGATLLVKDMSTKYNLFYDNIIENNIQPEGYSFSDFRMTLDFKAISALLMGEKIYGHKSFGLRELIQNSIDACKIRQEIENKNLSFGTELFQPKIKIILDNEKNLVIIKDNGTGMSSEVIKKHFLNIGVSYYNSKSFLLHDYNYKPIGNFGIGFLACFMLSDEVQVLSRNFKSPIKHSISFENGDEWISLNEQEDVTFEGTEIILNYASFLNVFENKSNNISSFLNSYFLTDTIQFELIDILNAKREIINKSLIPFIDNREDLIKVEFQKYLNQIEGCVFIKKKYQHFIRKFGDLGLMGDIYLYNEKTGLSWVNDINSIQIDDYITNNQIKYFSLKLVPSDIKYDFETALEYSDDDDNVFEIFKNKILIVSILIPKQFQSLINEHDFHDELNHDEANNESSLNITMKELIKIGHIEDLPFRSDIETIYLFEGEKNSMYLNLEKINYDFDFLEFFHLEDNFLPKSSSKRKLYLRNVLIQNFNFKFNNHPSIFEIDSIFINLFSRNFIPNIARDNFDSITNEKINYMIQKTIYTALYEEFQLLPEEKLAFQKFLNEYFSRVTGFEKEIMS